jgi:transcriptional regulator with XRE-family HTH domain
MSRTKQTTPLWVRNLRILMERRGSNPRRLSLEAGLNPTAVRDMLEGRTKFPRYDTAVALSAALGTTPALLMGSRDILQETGENNAPAGQDIDLLTEIIARLQEVIEEHKSNLSPRNFAAMATTIYRRLQAADATERTQDNIQPKIHDLLDYEMLRQRKQR